MEEKELVERKLKDVQGINIIDIKNTPFQYMETSEENYIICGKVRLKTEKTEQEVIEWINNKTWEAISLLIQALYYELKKLN